MIPPVTFVRVPSSPPLSLSLSLTEYGTRFPAQLFRQHTEDPLNLAGVGTERDIWNYCTVSFSGVVSRVTTKTGQKTTPSIQPFTPRARDASDQMHTMRARGAKVSTCPRRRYFDRTATSLRHSIAWKKKSESFARWQETLPERVQALETPRTYPAGHWRALPTRPLRSLLIGA